MRLQSFGHIGRFEAVVLDCPSRGTFSSLSPRLAAKGRCFGAAMKAEIDLSFLAVSKKTSPTRGRECELWETLAQSPMFRALVPNNTTRCRSMFEEWASANISLQNCLCLFVLFVLSLFTHCPVPHSHRLRGSPSFFVRIPTGHVAGGHVRTNNLDRIPSRLSSITI